MISEHKGRQLPLAERIDPIHTALLVVDVQNDFASPYGTVARGGKEVGSAAEMIERLQALIENAREAGVLIVYIRSIYDLPVLGRPLAEQFVRRDFRDSLCLTGTNGADFVAAIAPRGLPGEVVVTKHRYSPFGGSDIDLVLRSNGIQTVVVAGIVTEVCVESTARDAFFRDYRVVMAADCACPFSDAAGSASQSVLNQTFGRLATSQEIRAIWSAAAAGIRNWQPEAKAAAALSTLEDRCDPSHAALVLINAQNDFCHPDGALAKTGTGITMCREAMPHLRYLLDSARGSGMMVIHVISEDGPIYRASVSPSGHAVGQEPCFSSQWDVRIADDCAPLADEQIVTKHRHSGFADTRLDLLLRANGIRTVILAGFSTNGSIESTGRDAATRDYLLVVAEDCVATADDSRELHDASLRTLSELFGSVAPSSTITSVWKKASQRRTEATQQGKEKRAVSKTTD